MELNYPLTKDDWAKIYAAGTDLGPELTIRCENGEETKYIRLIRCKDCKYWHINCMENAGRHGCDVIGDYTGPDYYCASAEKR